MRRAEILDAALQLMHDKGYERMTIEDLLSTMHMSKGALYHYFRSKRALLDGVVEAMGDGAARELRVVVDDPALGAVDKLHAYFATSSAWKAENFTAVSTAMRLWRDENNALLRQKISQETMPWELSVAEVTAR